jgi:phospholipase/carboxylesterase
MSDPSSLATGPLTARVGTLDGLVVVLLLHGFGANEDDLAGLAPRLAPGLGWASLRAPLTLGPGSYAWFQVVTPGSPSPEPVATATAAIWDWVDAHVPAGTTVIPVGFSQGGLMATELLRTRPERISATVVLGGFVQAAERVGDAGLLETRPPAFWGRGQQDGVIAPHAVARTEAWLPAHTTLTRRVYRGLGHAISPAEVEDVAAFIADVVRDER